MKKIICILLIVTLLFGCSSCSSKKQDEPVKIAATCFAAFDFARRIVGDTGAQIELVGGGADLHSYNPSAADILTVSECDLLIYVGGESDMWIEDIDRKEGSKTVNMIEAVGERVYYVRDHGKETEDPDEHVWLSIENAHIISKEISDALSDIDSANALKYDDNRERFSLRLNDVDARFREATEKYTLPAAVVADRFAFAYMFKDYNIGWYSAFDTCSAESAVSFETVAKLAAVVDKYPIGAIAVTETGNKIADAVLQASSKPDCKIVTLDTMQSATLSADYLDIMQKNAEVISEILFEEN